MKTSPTAHRAIFGVGVLTVSVLALLSVATFSAQDRVGPGFHNAIGPVGHAIAEALRGFLGVCAWVLPLAGLYTAGLIFAGQPKQRRWPQVLCLGLLLVSGAVLAQLMFRDERGWAHAPGGLLGREVGGALAALFSTVGTIVLVSALASVALIVGTQFAFLRFCTLVWAGAQVLGKKLRVWGLAFYAAQKVRLEERKIAAAKAAEEEAAFLEQLEEQEAELAEMEASAEEADAIADENARIKRDTELERLMETEAAKNHKLAEKELVLNEKLVEREARVMERDALKAEREGLRAAREAAKERERLDAERLKGPVAAAPPAPLPAPTSSRMLSVGEDPAWASQLKPMTSEPPTPVTNSMIQPAMPSLPPLARARAAPAIVMPPAAPPQAFDSMPPVAAESIGSIPVAESTPAFAPPAPASALSTALARTPIIVEPKAPPKPTKKVQEQFEFVGDRKSFVAPPMDVLEANQTQRVAVDKEAYLSTAAKLSAKLRDFGIDGDVVEIRPGPVVTMYEFKPAPGIKISRIASLSDDLAMAMEAMRVRIVAPIPGKGVVGIEVPNKDRETVFLKEIAEQDAFQKSTSRLTMCLGKDIEGMPYVFDLAKAPHLLIAGTTGSGKSVAVNAMIMSILLKSTPEEVRFIMVDPKMLELSVYEGIPHLLLPVVTDPRKAAIALQWAVDEMTRRYKLLAEAGVRNIAGYNAMLDATTKKPVAVPTGPVIEGKIVVKPPVVAPLEVKLEAAPPPAAVIAEPAKGKRRKLLIVDVADGSAPAVEAAEAAPAGPGLELGVAVPKDVLEDPREGLSPEVAAELQETVKEAEIRVDEPTEAEAAALAAAAEATSNAEAETAKKKLPYIVVIIDELADLMMVASKEVETSVARLAQMARAAGIHLMVATQRPSTDVVTGVIKANFPTRITFMLRSKPDSMTVLGTVGAEALLGMGDMLILPPTSAHLQRVHGCYVSEAEIKRAVDHLKAQGKPVYDESILKAREEDGATDGGEEDELSDELYDQAVAIVSEMRHVSISMLQRKMRIGYNRAARMIERMERDGMVGAADGAKPRDVLVRPVGEMPGMDAM